MVRISKDIRISYIEKGVFTLHYFTYGEKEVNYLKEKDKVLGAAIDQIGMIQREVTPDPFQALISSIIGQQISTKASITVENRLMDLVGHISPENLSRLSIEEIQSCGMSMRKAGYIHGVIEAAMSGRIDFERLNEQSDEEVIQKLTSLYGVGIWTAEMILIFSLQRDDIVSYGDLAIRRGMMNLYGLDSLNKKEFETYRRIYSPHGSVASLYLWRLS